MSYATPTDFVSMLDPSLRSQLSAESGTAQDATIVQGVLDRASAEIDSRIGARYATPVTATVPAGWLKQKELIGAAWYLYVYRGIAEGTQAAAAAKAAWDDVLKWCDSVASGDTDLAGAAARTDVTDTSASWRSNTPVFTADDWNTF
jgi:phage gp36-like protein